MSERKDVGDFRVKAPFQNLEGRTEQYPVLYCTAFELRGTSFCGDDLEEDESEYRDDREDRHRP